MPKSAASAHMTTATLPLVAAALSFTAFLMTLNLCLPLLEAQSKRLPTTASEDLSAVPALPEEALASLTHQLQALGRAANTMSNTSTDTLLHDFHNPQGQLAKPTSTLQASLDTQPFALGLETTHAHPSYAHAKTRHPQPHTTWSPSNPAANPTLKPLFLWNRTLHSATIGHDQSTSLPSEPFLSLGIAGHVHSSACHP